MAAGVEVAAARREVVDLDGLDDVGADPGPLGELVDVAFEVFEADPGFRARRLLRPLLVDAESFELLVAGIDGFGGDAVRQALASVAPFARQLFSPKQVRNERLRALVADYAAPPPTELVRRTGSGTDRQSMRVRLNDLLREGDLSQDVPMRPGDTLLIPQAWF